MNADEFEFSENLEERITQWHALIGKFAEAEKDTLGTSTVPIGMIESDRIGWTAELNTKVNRALVRLDADAMNEVGYELIGIGVRLLGRAKFLEEFNGGKSNFQDP